MAKPFRLTIIATTVMIGLSAVAAIAAPPAGDADPNASQPQKGHVGAMHDKAAAVEQRITQLHNSLQITAAQQPQWDQFAQVMRDNAQDMDTNFASRMKTMASMTAPENMQSYAQVAQAHAQDVQKLVPVFAALYGTMSDAQKRTADRIFRTDPQHSRHS